MNRQEELERLLRKFTEDKGFFDKYGYIVHQIKETSDAQDSVIVKPDALGEATLYTAIAAIAISTGNYIQDDWDKNHANEKLQGLLTTLLKEGWGNKDNLERKHPIRHPEDIDYYRYGDDIKQRMSPLSKDSFGAIVAASYYCYSCPNSSQEVRNLARDLITKWTEYLILFQWRTHSIYVEGEFERSEQDNDYYKNIYSDDKLTNRKMYKGLESFMLWPHEMYALQNAAAHLGVPTSHWKAWEKIPVELTQTIVDFAAPYLAQHAGENLNILLGNFHFVIPYSIQIVPNWPSGKVEGLFVVEIPSHTREQIVTTFKETLKDLIREIIRTGNYINYQSDELLGILINRILNLFPDTLGPDSWRSILNKSIQQILPWITGEGWIEALTFLGFLQLLKIEDIDISTISYTLWIYAIECETRPEIKDILKAALQDFYSYLRGNDNPNSLWGWIAEDSEIVNEHIHLFESNEWNYWWKFAYQENKFNDWLKEAENPLNNEGNKRKSPRLDYLVLSGVAEKGPPAGITDTHSDWLELFRNLVKDAANHFINNLTAEIQRQFNQAGYYIRETLTEAGLLIKETWSSTLESTRETLLQGDLIGKSTWDQAGTLIHNMSKIDGRTVEEFWNRSTEQYWKGVWSTIEARAEDMIERAINTLEGQSIHEYWNRSTEQYWKGVWSTIEGRAEDMIERAINTLEGQSIHEYWNRSTEQYWKGVWSTIEARAEDMIERAINTLEGQSIHEYWNRSTEQYWKGVWSTIEARAEDMIERAINTLEGQSIHEYWNRSTEQYWKGVWSTIEGRAEDMIERAINTLEGQSIHEYWNRSTEKYWKGVWSTIEGRAEDMIERVIQTHEGKIEKEIWNAGKYGKSIFDEAGNLIEKIGDFDIDFPRWPPW